MENFDEKQILLGRIIDSDGKSLDNEDLNCSLSDLFSQINPTVSNEPVQIDKIFPTGIKVIDGFSTICYGQKLCLFANKAVGVTTLLGMFLNNSPADVNIVSLTVESTDKAWGFINFCVKKYPEVLKRTIVVCSTPLDSVEKIKKNLETAVSLCEYYRDLGKNVLFINFDMNVVASAVTQVALNNNEVVNGEISTSAILWYQNLFNRCKSNNRGTITSIFTQDDFPESLFDENIVNTMRKCTDGHIFLSRKIAEQNIFPAIDILGSISRYHSSVLNEEQNEAVAKVRKWLSIYKEKEEFFNSTLYVSGKNIEDDFILRKYNEIVFFIKQCTQENINFENTMFDLIKLAEDSTEMSGECLMVEFDYNEFAKNMAEQAKDVLPDDISDEAKIFTVDIIERFVIMAGEALVMDDSHNLTQDNILFICQVIAEWLFHKSVDLAHSEIPQENWEPILQKVAFTVFEIAKQACIRDVSQEDILAAVEHHVNKSFKEALEKLSKDNKISEEIQEKALKESNIDKMAQAETRNENTENVDKVRTPLLKAKPKRTSKFKVVKEYLKTKLLDCLLFIKDAIEICFSFVAFYFRFKSNNIMFGIIVFVLVAFHFLSNEIAGFVQQFDIEFSAIKIALYILIALFIIKSIVKSMITAVNADVQDKINKMEKVRQNMQDLVNPDKQYDRLGVDILSLVVGQGLLSIADPDNEEGTLLARIAALRQFLTDTLGYVIPNIRIMDSSNLKIYEYAIFVRGTKVANGFVQPNSVMIDASLLEKIEDKNLIDDITKRYNPNTNYNPITGDEVVWADKEIAKMANITGSEPANVIKEHLKKVVIKNVDKILTTSDVHKYLEQAKKTEHVENIINNLLERFDVEDIRKIFVNLIEEEVSIHDIVYILEKINAYSRKNEEIDYISERIRIDLADYISQNNANTEFLYVLRVSEQLDEYLENSLHQEVRGMRFNLDYDAKHNLLDKFKSKLSEAREQFGDSIKIVILCKPTTRRVLYRFLTDFGVDVDVMSYTEVSPTVLLYVIDEIE